MVIGTGMIAKAFESYLDQDNFLIFASGVSDSTHALSGAFERERQLLTATILAHADKQLVYFGTCSMYDESLKNSGYLQHKREMEALITALHKHYVIFRLSNPVGNTTNTTTLVNFFIKNISQGQHFESWRNASRNIIDIDDMFTVCNDILQTGSSKNETINIANPENYSVPFIISAIENHLRKKGNYTLVNKGNSPEIPTQAVEPYFRKFNINFGADYLSGVLQKYFPAP
ncbi:MAG: NAD-dependent epimerase/dehydratase family protein [Ferruginibacter sp.]|nr:NAD-dependent epimerase/dehydratase family protein [Ferruginibacter sp.]